MGPSSQGREGEALARESFTNTYDFGDGERPPLSLGRATSTEGLAAKERKA